MHVPYRLQNAFRVQTEIGIVLAMAISTATFVATPLVLSPLAGNSVSAREPSPCSRRLSSGALCSGRASLAG